MPLVVGKILVGFVVGILIFGLRVPALMAVGSDALFNFFTKIPASLLHLKKGTVRRKVVLALSAGSIPGSVCGVKPLMHIRHLYGDGVNNFIKMAVGILLIIIPLLLLFQGHIEGRVANRPPTMRGFAGMVVTGHDPVTEADRAVDAVLCQNLLRDGEGWLSEETADDPSRLDRERVWIVDPLDGTREFVQGLPEFCVSIGYVEGDIPVAGGIYNPATNETFLGAVDTGVFYNGKPASARQRKSLDGVLVLASRSEVKRGEWKQFANDRFKVQAMGSVAYKLAPVSVGLADVTFTLTPKNEWDVVAGVALVQSAGGFVNTLEKTPLKANRRNPLLSGLLACGPFLKDELLALTEPHIRLTAPARSFFSFKKFAGRADRSIRRVLKTELWFRLEGQSMRVLDLGCGPGLDLASWGVKPSDEVTGLDIDERSLATARLRFPKRTFVLGAGEKLPFEDQHFDRVISSVALPYMNIQKALTEIYRVLTPGGGLSLSLHLPSFTLAELVHTALPKPVPTLFRLYVMANGVWFHFTGTTVGFLRGRTESFQTERGMTMALHRAGFINPSFSRAPGPAGEMFIVETSTRKA